MSQNDAEKYHALQGQSHGVPDLMNPSTPEILDRGQCVFTGRIRKWPEGIYRYKGQQGLKNQIIKTSSGSYWMESSFGGFMLPMDDIDLDYLWEAFWEKLDESV